MLIDPSYFLTGVSNKSYFWACNECDLTVIIQVKALNVGKLHKRCGCQKWPILGGQLEGIYPVLR